MSENQHTERIAQQLKAQRPFVLYSDFNKTQFKAIFQNSSKAYKTSGFNKDGFVFVPFDLNQPAYIIPNNLSEQACYKLPQSKDSFFSSKIQTFNEKAHKELIKKKNGYYKNLYDVQFKNEKFSQVPLPV